ncbi:MAG: hypothetical protein HC859_06190 [Bacteroidia bacterium]|nr:hypothetical protein [Bacteroidia bacterium]
MRKSDWSLILPGPAKWGSAIGTGIGLAIVLRLVVVIYVLMLKGANFDPAALLTVNDDILSINQFYHRCLASCWLPW